jgi:hypothetical protein
MIDWSTCKGDFCADGSLRDIYITPATLADWRTLYPLLRSFHGAEYSIDGVTKPPPDSVEQVFETRRVASPMLCFKGGPAFVVFHFFTDGEIECDFVPNEITSQADLDALLGFIRQLGDATRKRVIIRPESRSNEPFISYAPESEQFEYHTIVA